MESGNGWGVGGVREVRVWRFFIRNKVLGWGCDFSVYHGGVSPPGGVMAGLGRRGGVFSRWVG